MPERDKSSSLVREINCFRRRDVFSGRNRSSFIVIHHIIETYTYSNCATIYRRQTYYCVQFTRYLPGCNNIIAYKRYKPIYYNMYILFDRIRYTVCLHGVQSSSGRPPSIRNITSRHDNRNSEYDVRFRIRNVVDVRHIDSLVNRAKNR